MGWVERLVLPIVMRLIDYLCRRPRLQVVCVNARWLKATSTATWSGRQVPGPAVILDLNATWTGPGATVVQSGSGRLQRERHRGHVPLEAIWDKSRPSGAGVALCTGGPEGPDSSGQGPS